jgi:sulfur-oxidizing protein SoxA
MPLRPRLPWRRATRVHFLALLLPSWRGKGRRSAGAPPPSQTRGTGLTALRRRSRANVGMGESRAWQGTLRSLCKLSACVCAALLALAIAGEPWRYSVAERRSGYTYLSEENQQLQDDDFANPGLLWVERGRELWQQIESTAGTSCAHCHGDAATSMRGVRPRYPRFDPQGSKLINLEQQLNRCRTERMHAPSYPYESDALLALTTFVAFQSRGLPIDVRIDGPAQPFFAAGKALYEQRRGQLDLACTHCHERYAGQRLRGDVISQGQINGFPIYRHTWQTLGSTHRMFAWCNTSVRSEPYPLGSDEYVNLELFVAWRGRGLPVETPAVRR